MEEFAEEFEEFLTPQGKREPACSPTQRACSPTQVARSPTQVALAPSKKDEEDFPPVKKRKWLSPVKASIPSLNLAGHGSPVTTPPRPTSRELHDSPLGFGRGGLSVHDMLNTPSTRQARLEYRYARLGLTPPSP